MKYYGPTRGASRLVTLAGAGIIALAVIGAGVGLKSLASPASGATTNPTFAVKRGPLDIAVSLAGGIQVRDIEVLKCEVEGQTTVLSIVPEGTEVKKGDLLIELDGTFIEEQLVEREIRVQNTEAAFIGARENFAVVENQAKSDVDVARLAAQFAIEDLENYKNGEFPTQLKAADSKIIIAKSELSRAEDLLAGSRKLFEKEFVTPSELQAKEQSAQKAKLDLELSQAERDLLVDFQYKRRLAELESEVEQTAAALERAERKASANIAQAKADLSAKEAEFNQQTTRLARDREQLTKTKIYATIDSRVIYATSGRGSWRGNDEPLDEGQQVRERQELIHLPTADAYKAEVEVHESSLNKLVLGQRVQVTVDALPDKKYSGIIHYIAPMPDAQSVWLNPDLKVYKTEIHLEGDTTGLRTGMSCRAEVMVDAIEDALYVPVQAITRIARQPVVYRPVGQQSKPYAIKLGQDNNRMAHVISGLSEGDKVLLNPPLNPPADIAILGLTDETRYSEPVAPEIPEQPEGMGGEGPDRPRDGEARDGAERVRGEGRPEITDEMRERFNNMTDEEKQKLREQWGGGRRGQRGGGEGGERRPRGEGGGGGAEGGAANGAS